MKQRMIRGGLAFLFLLVSGYALAGQAAPPSQGEPLKPLRTATPPVIDGLLDEALWQQAPAVGDFVTFIPDFSRVQAEKTIVYMAYDAENLYFAFRCLDEKVDEIKATMARRDSILNDDFVCINLDTFGDQQSLYAFYVNPLGIQADSRFASNSEDFNVDMVWYSAGQLDDKGYTVEIRIPLKSIRYNGDKRIVMGVFFERTISRRAEHGSYPALDPKRGYAFLTQMAGMEYSDLRRYTLLEVLPAFTSSKQYVRDGGRMEAQPSSEDFSVTGKYGITSSLILDGTYNPDFSQIEADAGQIDANLRYDLFYAEKRPFFLEGSEIFNVGAADFAHVQPVYTRTIVDPIAGVKLSGKLGRNDTIASVFAIDEAAPGTDGDDARFSLLRYRRTTSEDGYLGAMFVERNQNDTFNQVGGVDGQVRIGQSDMASFCALGSLTKDDGAARRFGGHSINAEYRYDSSKLGVVATLEDVSEDFRADAGYVTRTGISQVVFQVIPKWYPNAGGIRRLDPTVTTILTKDQSSGLYETSNTLGLRTTFVHNSWILATYRYSTEVFLGQRFQTSALALTARSQLSKQVTAAISGRYGKAIRYAVEPFQGRGAQVQASIAYLPMDNLDLSLNLSYADLYRDSSGEKVYDYWIYRWRSTYQVNKYLFFRAIAEYNSYRNELLTDLLASFTYIPGTVVHFGYGSLYAETPETQRPHPDDTSRREQKRGFFAKVSYLWRL